MIEDTSVEGHSRRSCQTVL